MSGNFSRFLVKFHTYLIVLWYLSHSCNQGHLYTHFSSTQTSLFPASSCVCRWQLNSSSKSHSTSGVRPSFRTGLVVPGFSHLCSTASSVLMCGPVLEFCEVRKFCDLWFAFVTISAVTTEPLQLQWRFFACVEFSSRSKFSVFSTSSLGQPFHR